MPNRTTISLRRTVASRRQKELFLILHDPGTLGEYLAWMRRLLEHNNADLEEMTAGSAVAEVERAAEMRATARKKNAAYDEVWCAFNREGRYDLTDARELAAAKGIGIAICDPTVDVWFLQHFEGITGLSPEEIAERLAKRFDKDLTSLRHQENRLFGKYDLARSRAISPGEDANPGSSLHRLVDAMRTSKQAFSGSADQPKL
ncbi:MAG: hypothetical protein JWP19_2204 [Rhodoglobus sp.]|nr:hypothetical protein [Rhodoglobus sp.]